jgi:hypothetical protein
MERPLRRLRLQSQATLPTQRSHIRALRLRGCRSVHQESEQASALKMLAKAGG